MNKLYINKDWSRDKNPYRAHAVYDGVSHRNVFRNWPSIESIVDAANSPYHPIKFDEILIGHPTLIN